MLFIAASIVVGIIDVLEANMTASKNHVWYQPYKLVCYALNQESSLMTVFSKTKVDAANIGKKQVIKKRLEDSQSESRVNSEARELHLLANKVNVGDYVVFPLDEKCLTFIAGKITGIYQYNPDAELIHSRAVKLLTSEIKKEGVPFELYKELSLCLGCEFLQRVSISNADFRKLLNINEGAKDIGSDLSTV